MAKQEDLPLMERDISWLSFNYRVLQEAKDPTVPLFERIKFMAIYSNNLDEFFRVRMANHRNLIRVGKKTKKALDYDPKAVAKKIQQLVNKQQEEYSDVFEKQIIPELQKHNIHLLRRLDLNETQREFVESYFSNHMLPFVQPVLLLENKIRPFLNNAALYLTIHLHDKKLKLRRMAIVKIPSDHLPRFIQLPSEEGRHDLIMLDDIVRHSVSWMFPGYEIIDTYSIKLTRDAELYIDDEFSGDLIDKIKKSLSKRHVGPASRFVYDQEMPNELLSFLMDVFGLEKIDTLKEGRYHNNFDFFKFPSFGMTHLKNKPLPPMPYEPLEKATNFYELIKEKDHLVHFPYHSYESVVQFFERAAFDPNVTHIKIIQYRVAKESRIMQALMNAVKHGKQVTAFIEVKARFDEEANLAWGERLEAAGVKVRYSFPGVKVHSKLALVRRMENDKENLYAYLSTGNFHEDTAKIYSDIGIFTADQRLVKEAAQVFSYLEIGKTPDQPFEHLLVGQFNLRTGLESLIDREIENALLGKKAQIILKMNSLQDPKMIKRLYEASNAGVDIKLIIRGICCLVPKLRDHSLNIEALSIVDRFLEHARIFIFHNEGKQDIYLSSADWMFRNLSRRIETCFPIYDKDCRKQIIDFVQIQLNDNVKARIINKQQSNLYRKTNSTIAVKSQEETYYYLKRLAENAALEAATKEIDDQEEDQANIE